MCISHLNFWFHDSEVFANGLIHLSYHLVDVQRIGEVMIFCVFYDSFGYAV